MTSTATRLRERLDAHGATVTGGELAQLCQYYDVLRKWNARINLTALADGPDAIDRLIVEPVLAARLMPAVAVHLDIGSGGGSPALPVRAMRAAYSSVLVESRARKAAFLREAARCMSLSSVRVEACRLEGLPVQGEKFTLVTVRAVRIDAGIVEAIERSAVPGVVLWYFAGPGEALTIGRPGWTAVGEHPLLPAKQSRALCFTWNTR